MSAKTKFSPSDLLVIFLCTLSLIQTTADVSICEVPISSPPRIVFIPKETARNKIKLKGETCARCDVIAEVGGQKFTSKANERGFFELEVPLIRNQENVIRIMGASGRRLSPPAEYRVVQKELKAITNFQSAPEIDYGSIPKFTNDPGVSIFGRTIPKTKVVATGGSAVAQAFSDPDGFFEILVFLKFDTLNQIEIYAEDPQGFTSEKSLVKIYQITKAPPAPNTEPLPKMTNKEVIKIKGETVPELTVKLVYPTGAEAESKADDKGKFTIDVSLIPNSENKFRLYTVDPAGNLSAPYDISIIQDNIPPSPLEVKFYPSKAYQDKITLIGKGEPDTVAIAQVGEKEFEIGIIDKAGELVAEVPILKYKRQTRRNIINIFIEDEAGNRSSPSIIVVDAIPQIRRINIDFGLGLHTFTELFTADFFRAIRKRSYDFWGLATEIDISYLLQRGSGLVIGGISGLSISQAQQIDFPITPGTSVVGDIKEVSKLSFTTIYLVGFGGFCLIFENIDLKFGMGVGPLFITKTGPANIEGQIRRVSSIYSGTVVKLSFKFRYFISEGVDIHSGLALGYSPVKGFPEISIFDAGGLTLKLGIGFSL